MLPSLGGGGLSTKKTLVTILDFGEKQKRNCACIPLQNFAYLLDADAAEAVTRDQTNPGSCSSKRDFGNSSLMIENIRGKYIDDICYLENTVDYFPKRRLIHRISKSASGSFILIWHKQHLVIYTVDKQKYLFKVSFI